MLKCTRLCAGVCEHKHDAVCLLETRKLLPILLLI